MRGDAGYPVRLRFTKVGKVRFVSHRDVARAFERAFRIEALPLAFTQGFSPRPKVSFGLALGVGHESVAEYLDVELASELDADALPERLSDALPEGIDVTGACRLADRARSLQEAVTAVELDLAIGGVVESALDRVIAHVLASDRLPIETTRKGEHVTEDLRPAIRRLEHTGGDQGNRVVHVELTTRPHSVRPADLLRALRMEAGAPEADGADRVLRTHQWIERDGARLEPLDADRAARTATPVRVTNKGLTDDRRDHSGGHGLRTDDAGATVTGARRIA